MHSYYFDQNSLNFDLVKVHKVFKTAAKGDYLFKFDARKKINPQ